ncbi:MAG TPA: HAMP domain-containing sensor histidine kinase, partial [Actinomycetota bacterium]|nr:HAMP domain-containing sensor histidine kinase [Actinomycetota bacterium]
GPVMVSVDGYRSSIRLVITDEGPGMNERQLRQVTQPLSQPDVVRSGSGLGLHIVKTLVVDHDGTLQINSGPQGTRVEISLPRWAQETAPPPLQAMAK